MNEEIAKEAANTAPAGGEQVQQNAQELMAQDVLGNEVWRWGAFFISIIASYIVGKILAFAFMRLSERSKNKGCRVCGELLKATSRSILMFSVLAGVAIGRHFLLIDEAFTQMVSTALAILTTVACAVYAWRLVEVIIELFRAYASKTENKMDDMLVPVLRTSLRSIVAILAVVQIVQIFSDKQITSIIAGLGIGGLAFALAAQDSLKQIFGSVVIFADKPFMVGDRVIVSGIDGVVEEVGLRSTRIRTLNGNLVTVPNGDLANQNIENVSRRTSIKRTLNVTITYDTPPEKVQRAVDILEEILNVAPGEGGRPEKGNVRDPDLLPKVFFNEFNSESLNILVLYWYKPADFFDYLAYTQWFNFELLKRYNDEGIDFAFPTQTLYLASDPKRPLDLNFPAGGSNGLPGKA